MAKLTKDQIRNKVNFVRKQHELVVMNDKDAIEAIEFVFELIEADIDITKQNEPYATSHIRAMEDIKYKIRDLQDYFED